VYYLRMEARGTKSPFGDFIQIRKLLLIR